MSQIMEAGIHKIKSIVVKNKGVEGMTESFTDVQSWRLGYNGILTVKGKGWTEVFSPDQWDRITITEE